MVPLLGLRVYLIGLILAVGMPVLLFAGILVWSAGNTQVRQRQAELGTSAGLIAAAIDQELTGMLGLLRGLAQSPALQEGNFVEFHQHATLAARPHGTVMSLQRPDGTMLLNTRVPFGEALPAGGNAALRERVIATGLPGVGDLYMGTVSRRPLVAAAVPATSADGQRFMLDMPIEPASLALLLARFVSTSSDIATLLDGDGRIIARSSDGLEATARSAPAWLRTALAGRSEGLLRGTAEDGTEQVIAFARPGQAPSWVVLVARPSALVDGAWFQPLARLATMGGLVLLAALVLAALLARAILRPVRALAAADVQLGDAAQSHIREFRALAQASEAARAAQAARSLSEQARAIAAAERAARDDATALFRAFAETTPDVVWIVDLATGRLSYLSPAYEGIWGEPRETVMADLSHWTDSVHPDDRAGFARTLAAVAAGETADLEYRVRRADGTERWIRDQAFPLRDAEGRVTRAAGIARDVSLRKEVEGRLRISDTRCTGLIDALGTLTWWSDAEGQVVEQRGAPVDAAALPRYPASAEESWLAWLSGPSRAALDAAWQQARAEQCGFHAVIEVAWPNAAPRHHLCRAAPIRMGDDGPVHEWAGVLLDLERPPEVATTDATNCGGREPVSVPPA